MKVRAPNCICALALVSLLGCKGSPDRPANVPAKALWIDGVFIECSLDKTSHANRCTVYDRASGEIQVSGLFVLSGSGREAKEDELLYQAFDGTTIFLQDARTLDPILLTEHKVPDLENRLTALAGIRALNCGRALKDSQAYGISDCALEAFAERKAFYVSYEYGVWAPGSSFGSRRLPSCLPEMHGGICTSLNTRMHVYPCNLWKKSISRKINTPGSAHVRSPLCSGGFPLDT